jgi:hypothetical protein
VTIDKRIFVREGAADELERRIVTRGEDAAGRVQQPAPAFVPDLRRDVLPARLG